MLNNSLLSLHLIIYIKREEGRGKRVEGRPCKKVLIKDENGSRYRSKRHFRCKIYTLNKKKRQNCLLFQKMFVI